MAYRSTKGQLDVKPGEENDVGGSDDAARHGGTHSLAAAGSFAEGSEAGGAGAGAGVVGAGGGGGGGGGAEAASMERFRVLLGAKECITE